MKIKADTFKKGDFVVMHSCGEANFPQNKGVVWECETDSFISSGCEKVFLKGFSGSFSTKYLTLCKPSTPLQKEEYCNFFLFFRSNGERLLGLTIEGLVNEYLKSKELDK